MRNRMRIAATLLTAVGVMCAKTPAQQNTNPFAEKISAQEFAQHHAPGDRDGSAWLKLAILYQDAARYTSADSAYHKAIALLKSKDRNTFAAALDHLCSLYIEQGRFSKAEPLEQKALEIHENAKDRVGIGVTYTHLASISYGRHDLASAEADAEMAASILIPENPNLAETGATPEEQMSALINLSLIRCAKGACAGAIHDLNRALNLAHAHYAINSVPVGLIDFLLGYAHWKSGDNRTASELMLAGTTEMEGQLGWGHPTYVAALRQYRSFLEQSGETAEASELAVRIASIRRTPPRSSREPDSILIGSMVR
ncbi:tetratricopeptide repeat protein [Telmatobacter sp. DSM 110680]|uniref:Tetratricopeptide repeat protein n=1 Tax=Telmatobacter sp. DSM 110680 TaxID=3036704 RepID=A0AAU7DSE5_9BACT